MEAVAARLQAMEAQQAELVAELTRQRQRTQAAEAGLQNAQAQLAAMRPAPGGQQALLAAHLGASVVDTRTLGNPPSFAGKHEHWKQFRFVFNSFACAAHPNMADLFRQAEQMGAQVIDEVDLDEPTTILSRQLYHMLVMLTTEDANTLISNVEQGNGAEAWRRPCWEYEPDVKVRHGAVFHALTQREFGAPPHSDLPLELEQFEKD